MRGSWLGPSAPNASFAGAAFDSRRVGSGELFFALPGENVDGYDFCEAAIAAGAAALVVDIRRGVPPGLADSRAVSGAVPVIGVDNPVKALGDLARAIRATFTGRVVGITGSNGKTTTRELTAAALGSSGTVLRTQGNYNTEIGLPLTIIGASGQEAFWVLEMAMRGRGQIALLAEIARPHLGVITNVAGAHLELLGSIEEIARAKGELFAALGDDGIAILPGGDALIEAQAAHLPEGRKWRFDAGGGDDQSRGLDVVILESVPAGAAGQIVRYAVRHQPVVARLPLAGVHNARNAAAALAVAAALGLPIPEAARALCETVLPPHRSFPSIVAGRIILDDCYNANPASMTAALAALFESTTGAGQPGIGAFAILGDMRELGPDTRDLHRAIGRAAGGWLAGLGVLGPLGAEIGVGAVQGGLDPGRLFAGDDPVSVAAAVGSWSRPGDWILVKASRGMRMERVIDALMEEFRNQAAIA